MSGSQNPQTDIFWLIIKRKWIIVGIIILSLLTANIYLAKAKKVYKAGSIIAVLPVKTFYYTMKPRTFYQDSSQAIPILTHLECTKATDVMGNVAKRVGFVTRDGKPDISRLYSKLNSKVKIDSAVLYLEVYDNDPERTYDIANIWLEEYVKYYKNLIASNIQNIDDSVKKETRTVNGRLQELEKEIMDYISESDVRELTGYLDVKKARLLTFVRMNIELDRMVQNRTAVVEALSARLRDIRTEEGAAIIGTDAAAHKSGVTGKLTRAKTAEYENKLVSDIYDAKMDLDKLKVRKEYLQKTIDSLKADVMDLRRKINGASLKLNDLRRDKAINQKLFENLKAIVENADVARTLQIGELQVVMWPIKPKRPIWPNKRYILMLVCIGSVFLGIYVAYLVESFERAGRKLQKPDPRLP